MFAWFDSSEAERFGSELAEFYDGVVRAAGGKADGRKHVGRQQKLIAQVLVRAQQFKMSHKLNLYKKAKLGNAFNWKLRDLGHDADLVELLTKDVLLALR